MTDPITTLISSYGGPDSNSYVSLSFANSYIALNTFASSVWTATSTTLRQVALVQATRDIDAFTYLGHRRYYDQYLKFPRQMKSNFPWNRTSVVTVTQDVTQKRMQRDVQEATCIQALKIVVDGGTDPISDLASRGVSAKSKAVGPVRESVTLGNINAANVNRARMAQQAYSRLQPWFVGKRIYRA